jgi:hypothetical protein
LNQAEKRDRAHEEEQQNAIAQKIHDARGEIETWRSDAGVKSSQNVACEKKLAPVATAIAHAQASNGCYFEALRRAQGKLRREIRAVFRGVAEECDATDASSLC